MSLADADSPSTRHQQHADMFLVPGGTFVWDRTGITPRKRRFIASQSMDFGWIARR
jgi:hypothetical protein